MSSLERSSVVGMPTWVRCPSKTIVEATALELATLRASKGVRYLNDHPFPEDLLSEVCLTCARFGVAAFDRGMTSAQRAALVACVASSAVDVVVATDADYHHAFDAVMDPTHPMRLGVVALKGTETALGEQLPTSAVRALAGRASSAAYVFAEDQRKAYLMRALGEPQNVVESGLFNDVDLAVRAVLYRGAAADDAGGGEPTADVCLLAQVRRVRNPAFYATVDATLVELLTELEPWERALLARDFDGVAVASLPALRELLRAGAARSPSPSALEWLYAICALYPHSDAAEDARTEEERRRRRERARKLESIVPFSRCDHSSLWRRDDHGGNETFLFVQAWLMRLPYRALPRGYRPDVTANVARALARAGADTGAIIAAIDQRTLAPLE